MDIKSLISLWNHTQQHPGTSGARACAGVLLGLYNGSRFPFDLTELRLLDPSLRAAAIQVITADATRCQHEVHEWLRQAAAGLAFGARFEFLASDYKCFKRGAMSLKSLREEYGERPRSLVIDVPAATVDGKTTASARIWDMDAPRGMGAQRHAAMLARNAGIVSNELFGMPIVENAAVPAGELWIQQGGRVSARIVNSELDTLPNLFQQRNRTE